MKTVIFRPLRRVKKTGKIVVASYMQWRKMATADYQKFKLIIDDEYKRLPKDEFVHDHTGELLYWFTFNPGDIAILKGSSDFNFDKAKKEHKQFVIDHGDWKSFFVHGLDSGGVPTFTHWTQEYVAREDSWNYYGGDAFEPLTVNTVTKWFGWYLYQLKNSYLQIGK